MINPWIQFFVGAVVIVWTGGRLTRSAKTIAENAGIGAAWGGALLLPLVTSLPELVTGIRSVTIGAPDLAVGNIFGSILFNLALLAFIDLVQGRGALTARVNPGHVLTASLVVVSLCLAMLPMLGYCFFPIGRVGMETVLLAAVYLLGSRLVFRYEKKNAPLFLEASAGEAGREHRPLAPALLQYFVSAGLIIAAGIFITDAADLIAVETGLGRTFVGSLFLAVITSLPEATTTIAAVRLGVPDMAVANVFGANALNLFIMFPLDLFYGPGPLLTSVSEAHAFSAVMAVLLTSVVIVGLVYRSQRELFRIGYDATAVVLGYLAALYILFISGGN